MIQAADHTVSLGGEGSTHAMTIAGTGIHQGNMGRTNGSASRLNGDHPTENVILPYDSRETDHIRGFISLLKEQAAAHGVKLPNDRPGTVANAIGRGFKTTFLIGRTGKRDIIKGMATTTEAASAEGRLLFLEDLVINQQARREGFGKTLFSHQLLVAWDKGYDGMAWETGRANKPACHLYASIDPVFDTNKLLDAWELPSKQWADLSRTNNPHAELISAAADKPLSKIAVTLTGQPESNLDYLSEVLRENTNTQQQAKNFIIGLKNGSFAIASEGYSTFDGRVRTDARLYLARQYNETHSDYSYNRSDVKDLVHGVSMEMANRNMTGSMHIEVANNLIDEKPDTARVMHGKLVEAADELRSVGGRPLVHDESPMIGYWLAGKRYVTAVINATERIPTFKLSQDSANRLARKAAEYGLSYTPR